MHKQIVATPKKCIGYSGSWATADYVLAVGYMRHWLDCKHVSVLRCGRLGRPYFTDVAGCRQTVVVSECVVVIRYL